MVEFVIELMIELVGIDSELVAPEKIKQIITICVDVIKLNEYGVKWRTKRTYRGVCRMKNNFIFKIKKKVNK